jgi:hypothetical protein
MQIPDAPTAASTAPPTGLPGRFQPDRLRRLTELTGPTVAPVLFAQFVIDLETCASQLQTGVPLDDWPLLRRASHDLIALAGSCGAMALHDLAQTANAAAHAQDKAAVAALYPMLAEDLAATLAMLRTAAAGSMPW